MKRRILPDFENETIPAYNFDVIIVGTGVAGLYAALNLDEDLEVAVVTKANIDESNSYLAQGGIAAVMTADDMLKIRWSQARVFATEKPLRCFAKKGPRTYTN